MLSQEQEGEERVIVYAGKTLKTLNKTQKKYCTTKKNLLAVVTFIQYFRHYFWGQKFTIRTDHASLVWSKNFKDAEGMLARWISKLETYNYKLEHRKGVKHTNSDALSRKPQGKCKRFLTVQTVGMTQRGQIRTLENHRVWLGLMWSELSWIAGQRI